MAFSAASNCGEGVFRWSYVLHTLGGAFIKSGTFCFGDSPRASCEGNVLKTFPDAFSANTSLLLETEFTPTDSAKRQDNPSTSVTIEFPEEDTEALLSFGTNEEQLALEGTTVNTNYYSSVEYQFSCYSVDEGRCPPCPSGDFEEDDAEVYLSDEPSLVLDFDDEFTQEICRFDLGFSALYHASNDIFIAKQERQLGWNRDLPLPLVRFDLEASSCSTPTSNGASYLALAPVEPLPDNFMVVDVKWEQIEGPALSCDPDLFNCGGDGNLFIFFPRQEDSLEDCPSLRWETTVFIGVEENEPLYSASATSCSLQFLNPPSGGECSLNWTSGLFGDDCNALPFSHSEIICNDWEVTCGEQNDLTTRLYRVSEAAVSFIPLDLPSLSLSNEFFAGDEDMDIFVEICNLEVCAYSDIISVEICVLNPDDRDDLIDDTLDNVADQIEGSNLDAALQALLAVGDSLSDCEDFIDEVVVLTERYIAAAIASVDGNTTNLGDATVLMELLGTIGEKSCSAPVQLFESLLLLCDAPTAADVQSFALDELLQAVIDTAKTDQERIDALDFAIDVNDCVQAQALPNRCEDRLSTFYEGASFSFAQYIFTMEQFKNGEVRIDIPNATVFFPEGFDDQIARDYTLATGDPIIRFSCVAINMARTNAVLSTGISIDSAIVGLTAMVYVNNTAVRIDLGHQGEPITDVILRIYRYDGDGTRSKSSTRVTTNGLRVSTKKEKERTGPKKVSKRVYVANSCEESISCSYYEGAGLLSTTGCETRDVTDEYVDCACDHYSNFGLLFSPCDSATWTIWRILSISFLATIWLILLALMALVLGSPNFRRRMGLESRTERVARVLGERSHHTKTASTLG